MGEREKGREKIIIKSKHGKILTLVNPVEDECTLLY